MPAKKLSKSKTKTRRSKKGDPIIDGSPITVGGGGGKRLIDYVNCAFSELDYPDPGGGPGRKAFRNAALQMQSLWVTINGQRLNLSQLLPPNGECTIEIKCRGTREHITITGRGMAVSLDTGKYPSVYGSDDHRSSDAINSIKRVIIDTPRGWFERIFARGETCEVWTNNLPNTSPEP